MVNYLFLVIIFLFMAIDVTSIYKFFRHKKIKLAFLSLIYLLITLITTVIFFSLRTTLIEELTYLIDNLKSLNILAIIVLLLNIIMIFIATISYIKVIDLERNKK